MDRYPLEYEAMKTAAGLLALALAATHSGCKDRACGNTDVSGVIAVEREYRGSASAFLAVGDCSGDGRPDVINSPQIFVARADGSFEARPVGFTVPPGTTVATLVDLDVDGVSDLVLAGRTVDWRRGRGDCRFDGGGELAAPTRGQASQVAATDIDLDGLTDLAVSYVERAASPIVLLTARGDGTFLDRTPAFAPRAASDPYLGYGTYFDDVDGDGARDLFVVADFDHGWMGWGRRADEPAFDRDARLTELFATSQPMSLCPLDADRDGRIDYFISGVTDANLLLHATGRRDLAPDPDAAPVTSRDTDFAWGCAALDADLDGWSDLLVLSLGGAMASSAPATLYLNRRDGQFGCVGPAVLDATMNAQRVVCADFDLDGQPDCVASDRDARSLVVLRDRLTARGHWVGLRLRGTVSSPEASGARVSLDGASPPLVVVAGGQSPIGGEHDRGVVLAVGALDRADVTVTWPSGVRQSLRSLPTGAYAAVEEPRVLTVAPRVAPADGTARVEVVVDAAAAGALAATIGCSGACAWEGPATTDATGRTHRWLVAPTTPGSVRVEVALDGVALAVRPRVRFGP